MGTTVINNAWKGEFLDHMSDAEAGRLFKAIMDIRCGVITEVPDEFKYVLPGMIKFRDELDAKDALYREKQRQRVLKRWHSDSSSTPAPVPTPVVPVTPVEPKEPVRIKKAPAVIDYSDDFIRFWNAYPKKKKKAMAYLRWNEAISGGADGEMIIRKASDYAKECSLKHVEERYIMYPEGWINQARYDDDFFTGTEQVDLDAISDGLDDILG